MKTGERHSRVNGVAEMERTGAARAPGWRRFRNGVQRFDAREAGHHAVLMALAVASLALPSLFLASTHSPHIAEISLVTAGVLLAVYGAYLLYSMLGIQGGQGGDGTFIEEEGKIVQELHEARESWPLQRSVPVLALSTALVFGAAEALIGTIEPFTTRFGWSPVFVGIVLVPVRRSLTVVSCARGTLAGY